MQSTLRPGPAAEQLLGIEALLHEIDQGVGVLGHKVGCERGVALRNRIHRWLLLLFFLGSLFHHLAEAAVHFLDRHFFLYRAYPPGVSERIEESSHAVSVELVAHRTRQFGARRDCVLDESVHVSHIDLHADRRVPQRLGAVAAPFRPLFREHDDRISNHHLRMADTHFVLEAECFLGSESIFVEFDGFGCVLEA